MRLKKISNPRNIRRSWIIIAEYPDGSVDAVTWVERTKEVRKKHFTSLQEYSVVGTFVVAPEHFDTAIEELVKVFGGCYKVDPIVELWRTITNFDNSH